MLILPLDAEAVVAVVVKNANEVKLLVPEAHTVCTSYSYIVPGTSPVIAAEGVADAVVAHVVAPDTRYCIL